MAAGFEMQVIEILHLGDGDTEFFGVIPSCDPDLFIERCQGELWVDGKHVADLAINGESMGGETGGLRSVGTSDQIDPALLADPQKCRLVLHFEEGDTAGKACRELSSSLRLFATEREPGAALAKLESAEATIAGLPSASLTDQRIRRQLARLASALRECYTLPHGTSG